MSAQHLIIEGLLEHPANVLMARVGASVGWDFMMLFDDIAEAGFRV
ncbi:MAG: hypothetical protein ACOY30_15715 [Bacillota bacterium]